MKIHALNLLGIILWMCVIANSAATQHTVEGHVESVSICKNDESEGYRPVIKINNAWYFGPATEQHVELDSRITMQHWILSAAMSAGASGNTVTIQVHNTPNTSFCGRAFAGAIQFSGSSADMQINLAE